MIQSLTKNISIYWIICTALAIWFLFAHSPPALRNRLVDAPFAIHLAGAYAIYLACIHNTLITPSCFNGNARKYHIWVGRIGMIAGLISFAFGIFCAWYPHRENKPPRGFSIGISIGGVGQIVLQVGGYLLIRKYQEIGRILETMNNEESVTTSTINEVRSSSVAKDTWQKSTPSCNEDQVDKLKEARKEALIGHVICMVILFATACGSPALMRFLSAVDMPGSDSAFSTPIAVLVLLIFSYPFQRFYTIRF